MTECGTYRHSSRWSFWVSRVRRTGDVPVVGFGLWDTAERPRHDYTLPSLNKQLHCYECLMGAAK